MNQLASYRLNHENIKRSFCITEGFSTIKTTKCNIQENLTIQVNINEQMEDAILLSTWYADIWWAGKVSHPTVREYIWYPKNW